MSVSRCYSTSWINADAKKKLFFPAKNENGHKWPSNTFSDKRIARAVVQLLSSKLSLLSVDVMVGMYDCVDRLPVLLC